MNVREFIAKWRKVELKERSAAQEHFIDLCGVVGHKTPADADPTGDTFCFERGAAKQVGGDGWADVWKKDFFGVLHSKIHELWARGTGTQLREVESGFRYTPTACFETFPFPKATPVQEQAITEAARELDTARQNWLGDRSDKKRTLTNLYNQRPTWLDQAHRKLDDAVFAAYGWPPDLTDDQILEKRLQLNLERA